jgi:colanic acid/amylovoran biosynthesis glycosyltransferase
MTLRRIAYVVNVFPKLSETFIAGELAELQRRGVEVRVLSLRLPQESLRHEIVTRARLVQRTVYDHGEFRSVLRAFQPELLHAHFATEPTAAARELAAEFGLPFTFTAHGYDLHRKPPADFGERAAAAAAVITVCQANAQHLTQVFGVPAGHIRVIPCGVDLERFRPQGSAADRPRIVCVARLVPVKNLELLLHACHELQRRGVRFRCVIVGEGPRREQLEATRTRLGLEGVVELVGAAEQAEVLSWWRRAAVAVLTSEREGMPVSLIEAAACGLPAVATAVGGIPELVEDGVTGRLVPPGDPLAFAGALEELLRDPSLAARLGRAARQRVEERFSLRHQVNQLLDVWAGLVCGRASGCAAYR